MAPETPQQSFDIREYLRPLRDRWWLIVLIVAVVTVGTYIYYDRKPDVFAASSQLYVESSSLDEALFGNFGGQPEDVQNLSLLLQTTPVAEVVAKEIGFKGNPRALLGTVSAAAEGDSSFITVTASAGRPRAAAELANAFAQAFIDIRTREIERQAGNALEDAQEDLRQLGDDPTVEPQRTALIARIDRLELVGSAAPGAGIQVIETALVPAEPIEPNPTQNAIFAFVVSLALAIAAAFGLERLDRRLQRVEDVEEAFGKPVLTELPRVEFPAPMVNQEAVISDVLREPFRRLQMNLDIASGESSMLETIVVASAAPGEGKSIVARNVAIAYRDAGKRVALFDADFRKPSVARLLDLQGEMGLANVLAGSIEFEAALQDVPGLRRDGNGNGNGNGHGVRTDTHTAIHGGSGGRGVLAALTAGPEPANPAAALATTRMQDIIETAAEQFDTVLIDSPPILAVSDALPLLSAADGVILVTRIGVSTRDSARRMLSELELVPDVNVIGVVVNAVPPKTHRSRAYGYGYGYSAGVK